MGNLLNLTTLTSENKKGYGIAIRLVAAEIEKHYGRLKPTSAAAETFAQKKHEILKAIDEREHFRLENLIENLFNIREFNCALRIINYYLFLQRNTVYYIHTFGHP